MTDPKRPTSSLGSAARRAGTATADGVNAATSFVVRNEGHIADGAQMAVALTGAAVHGLGKAVASGGYQAGTALHGAAKRAADSTDTMIAGPNPGAGRRLLGKLGGLAVRGAMHAAGITSQVVGATGTLTEVLGTGLKKGAPAAGGALGGAVSGVADLGSNAVDAVILSSAEIERLRDELRLMGDSARSHHVKLMQAIESAQARGRKDEVLDLLTVGGVTLAQALKNPAVVPPEVEEAFELAYPGLAGQGQTFSDAVARMDADELPGLVSGVKGKIFELELVDHLNDGGLSPGEHAALAPSTTQPGWDIQITDEHGQVIDFIQAKATESVGYVKEALNTYPDIHVTTTSEVYAQLAALSVAGVNDSGISEAALEAKLVAAEHAQSGLDASDLVPSSLGLAVIALSAFLAKDGDLRAKATAFGKRSAKAGGASYVGKAAMVATQTWWLGLIAGVGSRWLASHGQAKRQQYFALREAVRAMEHVQQIQAPAAVLQLR